MTIHKIVVGALETNCYILHRSPTSTQCVIMDPGDEADKILDFIEKNNLKPTKILLTHDHFDHVGALDEIKDYFHVSTYRSLTSIGWLGLKMIKTPGHTPDSVCFVDEKEGVIFSGDTLFRQGIGRTDLEGGDYNQIQESLKKLMQYPDHFKVYPGHGPETTIGEERKANPFLVDPVRGRTRVRDL